MKRSIGCRSFAVMLILVLAFLATGCGRSQGGYKDDVLIGFFSRVDAEQGEVIVDISDWAHRNDKGPGQNDWGAEYHGKLTSSTIIRNEAGETVDLATLKEGQRVRIYPPDSSTDKLDELVVLEMTEQEKYKRMGWLAQGKGRLHTVVVSGENVDERYDDSKMEQEIPSALKGGLALMGYVPDHNAIIDVKGQFELEAFPAFLVFDNEKLVYKTYDTAELEKFLRSQ
ncbi:hypothetical protein [Paenibacillus harenae]|uniref:DUF3221 domain-containing protein n=1 Tax=Paenibacillus harenae TaxID=306543 RepID=A0ABT9U7N6_PAEHA|nr:hypothetical protein [Paenibacillus harenae]MDQ0115667.1 hypothetical protein [Paenibacillus harenae]